MHPPPPPFPNLGYLYATEVVCAVEPVVLGYVLAKIVKLNREGITVTLPIYLSIYIYRFKLHSKTN